MIVVCFESDQGECTVTYDDQEAATSAVSWFNGKDFDGETIKVSIAQRKAPEGGFGRGRGRGGGGGRGRGGKAEIIYFFVKILTRIDVLHLSD